MDICVNYPDCHGRAEFCCRDCHLQREQGVFLCEDCTNKIHSTHFCKYHQVTPLEPKTTERRLSQDVSTFESFVTVQKEIFQQITNTVQKVEQEDKEFLSLVQQTLVKRAKEMTECRDKIQKAMHYLDKVSVAIKECNELSDGAKFSVLQSAITDAESSPSEKMSSPCVKVIGSLKKNGCFWVCKCGPEESSSLDQLGVSIRSFFQVKGFDYIPDIEEGMLCVVKRNIAGETSYLRGRIEKVGSSSTVTVRYLDKGNSEDVAQTQLTTLPEQFRYQDFQAFECCLFSNLNYNLPYDAVWCFKDYTNKRKLVAELQEQLPNTHVTHVILKTLDDPPVCVNQRVRATVDECNQGAKEKPVMPKEETVPTAEKRSSSPIESLALCTEQQPQDLQSQNLVHEDASKIDKEASSNLKDNKSGSTSHTEWQGLVKTQEAEVFDPKPGFVTGVQRDAILRSCAANKIVLESIHQARYFLVRDELKTVVEAMKQDKWCANRFVLRTVNSAFIEQARRGHNPVFILFHVIHSDSFAGVAQMTSTVDYKNYSINVSSLVSTSSQVCHGEFSLRWIYVHFLPFEAALNSHISHGFDNLRALKTLKSGKELPGRYGAWLLKRFDEHSSNRTVLDIALVQGRRPSLPKVEKLPTPSNTSPAVEERQREDGCGPDVNNKELEFHMESSENWEQEVLAADNKSTRDSKVETEGEEKCDPVQNKDALSVDNSDAQSILRAGPDSEESEKRSITQRASICTAEKSEPLTTAEEGGKIETDNQIDKAINPVLPEKFEIELTHTANGSVVGTEGVDTLVNGDKGSVSSSDGEAVEPILDVSNNAPEPQLQMPEEPFDVKVEKTEAKLLAESLMEEFIKEIDILPENPDVSLNVQPVLEPFTDDEFPNIAPADRNKELGYVMKEIKTDNGEFKLMLRDTEKPLSNEISNSPQKAVDVQSTREKVSDCDNEPACHLSEELTSPTSETSSIISLEPIPPIASVESASVYSELSEGFDSQSQVGNELCNMDDNSTVESSLRATAEEWFPSEEWTSEDSPVCTQPNESWLVGDSETGFVPNETCMQGEGFRDGQECKEEAVDDDDDDVLFPVKVGKTYSVKAVTDLGQDGVFWCRLFRTPAEEENFMSMMERMNERLQKCTKPLSNIHLMKECCVRRKGGTWFRAYIEEIDKKDPSMVFVRLSDLGSKMRCSVKSLVEMDLLYYTYHPHQAFECMFTKKTHYSSQDREKFRREKDRAWQRGGPTFNIHILDIEGTTASVKIEQFKDF